LITSRVSRNSIEIDQLSFLPRRVNPHELAEPGVLDSALLDLSAVKYGQSKTKSTAYIRRKSYKHAIGGDVPNGTVVMILV
jgi:hypothetical protein